MSNNQLRDLVKKAVKEAESFETEIDKIDVKRKKILDAVIKKVESTKIELVNKYINEYFKRTK